jgi:hypothetical protein
VGQKPITWYRQVMALVNCPSLLDEPSVKATFPADVQQRAAEIVAATAVRPAHPFAPLRLGQSVWPTRCRCRMGRRLGLGLRCGHLTVGGVAAYCVYGQGGTGAYSHSKGVTYVRDLVAKFLQERDG